MSSNVDSDEEGASAAQGIVIKAGDVGSKCMGTIEAKVGGRRHSRRHHRRHRHKTMRVVKGVHVKAKTLKRLLKSKGLKTSGKKATLRARARKAHLIRGGGVTSVPSSTAASV
jgi:hypothetical protein